VSCEEEDVQSARGRWKAYRAAGWTIVHHGAAHD
jgi:DNA polymerase IIIc chi subunit